MFKYLLIIFILIQCNDIYKMFKKDTLEKNILIDLQPDNRIGWDCKVQSLKLPSFDTCLFHVVKCNRFNENVYVNISNRAIYPKLETLLQDVSTFLPCLTDIRVKKTSSYSYYIIYKLTFTDHWFITITAQDVLNKTSASPFEISLEFKGRLRIIT